MKTIDTHAHIYSSKFKNDREEAIERAIDAGVHKIFMPNIDHKSIDVMLETEQNHPNVCYSMMGLHPCSVKSDFEKELYIVEDWLSKRSFIAIGEMGLDYYWEKDFVSQQKEAFRIQAEWAKKYQRPLVIHSRDAMDDCIDLVEELKDDHLTGVLHCFTGNIEQAKRLIDLDFKLGIGGVVTFKNSGLDKVLPELSIDDLVLETDCPYLAPVPYRGKRNEVSYVPLVAHKVAQLLDITHEEVAEKTTKNALSLFKI